MGCRLCGGTLSERFTLEVLGRISVKYFFCEECKSLQTEVPHWLDKAYDDSLSHADTGAAQRGIRNLAACFAVSTALGMKNVIDFGGGDGLLCRLLRDYGINCFVHDRYAKPSYAQEFTVPNFSAPDMVSAFEVFEHLPHPAENLKELFEIDSKFILISTEIFSNQTSNWWYLAPESGQHVFFYSRPALQVIANRFDYDVMILGEFIIFSKHGLITPLRRQMLKFLLRRKMNKLIASLLMLLPTPGVQRDFEMLRSN